MGRPASRRRTRRHPRGGADRWASYDVPPGSMWHEPGSDFEPSPLSPAGRAQVGWRLLQSLAWGGRRRRPWIAIGTKVVLVGMLAVLLVGIVSW